MDNRNIFKKLTCGASFTRNKNVSKLRKLTSEIISLDENPDIKIETDNTFNIKKSISDDEVDEKDISIKLLENDIAENRPRKKKKEITIEKIKLLEIAKINQIRNTHQIHVSGKNPSPPIETFKQLEDDYKVSTQIMNNLHCCGYDFPTPIQMQVMPIMMDRRSLLACAPTGSGKTAAFLIPIIKQLRKPQMQGFRALILCPTRELAKQTQRECLRLVENIDLRVHILNKTKQAEKRYGVKSNKAFDILITTPKRICYLINENRENLDLKNVKWLILDEGDKFFEEGKNNFREQFDQINNACTSAEKTMAFFSATWTNSISKWCRKNIKGMITVIVGQRNSATDLVDQELLFVGSESGKLVAFRDLLRKGLHPPALVFVESKDRAQQLFNELIYDSIKIDVIHSDRTQQERDNVVKAFREGKIWVLICTELIGRGIDFKGVNLVINYDFPSSKISYIHRIGRTGRAGRKGKAITFFTQTDTINLKSIANVMKNSGCYVPPYVLAMKQHSKRERKKLEKTIEKREDISTIHSFQNSKATINHKAKHNFVNHKKSRVLAKQTNYKQKKTEINESLPNFVSIKSKRKMDVNETNIKNTKKRKL